MPEFLDGVKQGTGGGAGSSGKVLQVVTAVASNVTTTVTIPFDDTIPQNTEGAELLTLAFTPLSATSTLHFSAHTTGRINATTRSITLALFVDTTADALRCGFTTMPLSGGTAGNVILGHSVASASTSARTYKLRFGADASGTLLNHLAAVDGDQGGTLDGSRLTITEVEA